MKKFILILNFFLISYFSNAQMPKLEWAKSIGSKNSESNPLIRTDSSGNVIIVGGFNDTIDFDLGAGKFLLAPTGGAIFILKLDSTGNFIWADKIESAGFARPLAMVLDKNNNIYITGHFYDSTDFDPGINTFIIKSVGPTYTEGDVFTAKYNSSGSLIWAKAFTGPSTGDGLSIAVDRLGNVYTSGTYKDSIDANPGVGKFYLKSKGLHDAFISKLDASGNFVWAKSFGSGWDDAADQIIIDTSGYIYVSGIYRESIDFDFGANSFMMTSKGYSDVYILKLDAQANFIWAKSIGGPSADYLTGMVMDAAGNIFLTGLFQLYTDADPGTKNYTLFSNGDLDIFLIRLDNNGTFAAALSIGGVDYERATDIDLDRQGNIFLTGEFRGRLDFDPGLDTFFCTPNGYGDLFVLKLDSNGNFVWEFNISGSKYEHSASITLDNDRNIYSAGVIQTSVDCDPGSGKFEVKHTGLNDIVIGKFKDYCSGMNLAIDSFRHITCKDTTGYILLKGIRGKAPYTYEWNTVPTTKDSACSFYKRGVYTLMISDANACERKTSFLINGPVIGTGFDLNSNLIASGFRPGRGSIITAIGFNDRCKTITGRFSIVLDKLLSFNSSLPMPDKISGDTLFWNFNNITYETKPLKPLLFLTTNKNATIGDTVCFDVFIFPIAGDADLNNNTKRYCYPVSNSYDPNIKSVYPQGACEQNYVPKDKALSYTIQFQNTGNAEAIDIFILDTLDSNLDMNSLRVIGQSDSKLVTEILSGNVIKFRFDNINLPDSFSNEPGSHGYVIYEVMPKSALPDETIVKGNAGIYFDFNPPVFTNEVKNALIDTIPCLPTIDNENNAGNGNVDLYPNPNSGKFTLEIENPEKGLSIEVYNLVGEQIKIIETNSSDSYYFVDMDVAEGMYLVKVMNNGVAYNQKVIIVK